MNDDTQDNPLRIGVVIPAYNSAAHIGRAIDSVLAQTRPADEIIVVDDGSTDATADVIRAYGPKIRLIPQANTGASAARNAGINAATGDWIAFLDADDEWLPDRLAVQAELLTRRPDLVWVSGNYINCSCAENRQSPYILPQKVLSLLLMSCIAENFLATYSSGLTGHTDVMLIRKDVLVNVGLFDTSLKKAEDIDLWWRIAYRYPKIGFSAEPLAVYHLGTPDSLNKNKMQGAFFAALITRHLSLAEQFNRQDVFRPLAAHLLRGWMRSMLFTAQAEDIRLLLNEFSSLFPRWYHLWMRFLTTFPDMTASGCHLISKIIRRLKLRRRGVLPPPPQK
jgi:glycosyltransferase involved in cell wall biosynthesis